MTVEKRGGFCTVVAFRGNIAEQNTLCLTAIGRIGCVVGRLRRIIEMNLRRRLCRLRIDRRRLIEQKRNCLLALIVVREWRGLFAGRFCGNILVNLFTACFKRKFAGVIVVEEQTYHNRIEHNHADNENIRAQIGNRLFERKDDNAENEAAESRNAVVEMINVMSKGLKVRW